MGGGAWLRHGGPAHRNRHHVHPDDGGDAGVAAGGAPREGGRAHFSWRAIRTGDRALQLQERASGERVSSEHRSPRGRALPAQAVQGPDDQGRRVPDHAARPGGAGSAGNERAAPARRAWQSAAPRRPRHAAADSTGAADAVVRRSAAGRRRRNYRRAQQERRELAAHVSRRDALRPVAVRLQQRSTSGRSRRTRHDPGRARQSTWFERAGRQSREPRRQHHPGFRLGIQSGSDRDAGTCGHSLRPGAWRPSRSRTWRTRTWIDARLVI
jgi:hypothetical protein